MTIAVLIIGAGWSEPAAAEILWMQMATVSVIIMPPVRNGTAADAASGADEADK